MLTLVDRDEVMTHPQFRRKLEAIGFGFFIPVFFVTSGVRFDLDALLASAVDARAWSRSSSPRCWSSAGSRRCSTARLLGARRPAIAGLLQATSLPFIVAATAIGLDLELIGGAEAAALIAAGLLSVLIFPLAGLDPARRWRSVSARRRRAGRSAATAARRRRARPPRRRR